MKLLQGLFRPWQLGYAAVGLWLMGGLFLGAWYLKDLPLAHIEMHGRKEIPEAEILVQSGITKGMPMGVIDPFFTMSRLMAHPRIRTANVRRNFPDQILIELEERMPTLALVSPNNTWVLLDSEGVVLSKIAANGAPPQSPDLLKIHGLPYDPALGERVLDPLLDAVRLAQAKLNDFNDGAAKPVESTKRQALKLKIANLEEPLLLRLLLADGTRLIMPPDRVEESLKIFQSLREEPEVTNAVSPPLEYDFSTLDSLDRDRIVLRTAKTP